MAGLFPQSSISQEDDETLHTRRAQRVVTTKLVQAMQVLACTILQGCSVADELQQDRALRGGAPVQGYGWNAVFKEYQIYFLVFVLLICMVLATTCTMSPGRRLGPQRGERQQQGGASSSSRPTGGYGDRRGEDPTRRSRTTSRDRGQPAEDVVATLHRRLALMFATVLEGNYTPRETVTPFGIKQTLPGAARSLDDGYSFVIKDALDYLDGPEEHKAKELPNDVVKRAEKMYMDLYQSTPVTTIQRTTPKYWIPGVAA